MKKLLTILILLLAVASQSWADGVETILYEGEGLDNIELNSETVSQIKENEILRIYLTVPNGGANFKLFYKGSGNSWTETAIPSVNNQWPWVNSGNDHFDVTFTNGDISALNNNNIYINKGENSIITKISLIKSLTPEENATVDGNKISVTSISSTFAGAYLNIGGLTGKKRLLATFAKEQEVEIIAEYSDGNKSYITKGTNSDTDGDYTVALGLDDSKTLSRIYLRKVSTGDITLKSVAFDTEEVSSNGDLYNDDGTINLLKIAPQNIDETAYNVDNFKITSAAAWKAVQLWLNENDNVKGDMLTIKLASTLSVELNVSYYGTDTPGPSISLIPSGTPAEVNLPLDGNKTINKIEIKSSAANQEITLSEISIASAKEVFKPNETLTLEASTDTKGQSVSYYKFGNASSGDKILVYVAGSDVSMDMKAGGDNPLRGHTYDSSINQTSSISESSSVQRVFVYELTEGNRLNYIKDHGFYIEATSGSCTLDKIMLVSANDIPTSEPNIFDGNDKADISRASTDGEGTYNFSSETGLNIAASAGKGITLSTVTGETVNRKELAISLDKAIPVTVQYTIGGESKTAILNAKDINLTLDENKALTQVSIKPVNATTGDGSVTVINVAVSSTSSASTASNTDELWAGSRAITAEYGIPFNYKYDRLAAGDVIRVTYSGDGDLNAAISYSTDGSAKTSISSLIADLEAKTLEFAVTSDMLEAIKTYGLYVSGNLTLSKVERITASTIPAESALADGETIVLWKSQAGEAIDYSVLFTVGSALAGIIEKNEQILVSVSSIETGDGKYNKVWACSLSDTNTQLITEQHLENASGTLALSITADKLESLRSGFGIAADDMTITEVSLRKPKLIDSFTGYTNAEAHTMTAKQWNGGITLDYGTGSDESAAYLTVETSEGSVLKHEITFTDGWVYEYYDSEATSSRTIALDATKKIQKIFLQNANSENASTEGTVTFSNIALSSTTSGSAVTPSTKKVLANAASITGVNTKAGRLVFTLTNALATTVKIGYDDETVALYPVNNTANRNLALDATKTISTIDIVKADGSETVLAISENNIYLQMTSVEGDEAAITKPTADANTTLFVPSAGVAMSGDKICLVGAAYVTNLLEAGLEMNVTLSKGENPVLKLLNESGDEVKSYNLKDLQGSVARIPVTATLLTSIANGFSLSGSDITISKVDIYKPATQTAPTTENSLTIYNNDNPEMTGYADICYVNSGYGAVFEEDMELRITIKDFSSATDAYRKVLIHDANSMEQLGAGFAEVSAVGDVVFTLTAADVEAMKNGFSVLAQNVKVSKIVLAKSSKTEKTLKEMSEAVAIGDGDITINHGLFANAEVGDVIRIYGGSFGAEPKVAVKIGETENCLDGAGWPSFTSSPFSLTLTESVLAIVKAQDIRISGQDYSFSKTTLLTSQNLGGNIYKLTTEATNGSITVKKGTEETTDTEFASGTELTFIAEPADNFTFKKWQKDGVDIEGATTATLTTSITTDMTITAVFQPTSLQNEERRTLWEGDGQALAWSDMFVQTAGIGSVVEAGEILIVTAKTIDTSEGHYPKIILKDTGGTDLGTIDPLVVGENKLSVTSSMATAMAGGFKFQGESAIITKIELYKPVTVFSEAGVADLTTMTESEGKSTLAVPHEESLKGNVLVVESTEDATVTVTYADNTTATNKAGNRKVGTPAASQALVLLDANKYIAKIEVNKAKSVISKIYTATLPVLETDGDNYAADLAMATADAGVLYDTSSFTIAVSSGWKGISLTSTEGETVKGAEISLTFGSEAKVKTTAYYTDGTDTGETGIMSEAATVQKLAIDNTKTIKSISIQPQEAGAVQLKEVKVNAEVDVQKYTLTLSTPENGTVVIKKGNEEVKAGEFDENTELTLTATAAEGYEFTKWQKNGEDAGTEATLTVKMTADMTIAAVFSKKTEPIIDEETGETDLTEMTPQDPSTTTVEYNEEDQSITITTTEPYKAAQIWFNEPEKLAKGNVLIVDIAESGVNVTVTVKYTDGTESSMTSTAHAASSRHAAAAGTKISVPLETGKDVQNIEVKNSEAGTITIQKMVVTTKNVFTNGVADLSMAKPQSNAIYDTSTYSLAVTKGWTGITITPLANEQVSGVELMLQFTSAAQVKAAVTYNEGEGPSVIMDEAAKYLQMTLDKTKTVKEIQIQPTTAGVIQLKSLAVNQTETENPDPDYLAPLEYGERRTLFESTEGTQLSWNDICQMAANYGAILEEREQIEVYISARVEGCDWPKVFIKDAAGAECGSVLELNSINQFPYMAKFKLNSAMAEQLSNGFSISGDGIIVTKVCLYKPEALKPGDIDIADLNGGYQSSYDATSKTITTTSRWAARGWDIGDGRYNGYDVIVVEFEAVDFPVTLRMEYVDADGATKTLSQGASAGSSQVAVEIPDNIQQINYVYLMYENPGTLILLNADVLTGTYIRKVKTGGNSQWDDGEAWYRLDGKRVSQPGRGIYIHNGKKIVIK